MRRHPARAVSILSALMISVAVLVGGWWFVAARSSIARAVEDDLRVATQAQRRSDWGEARSALERARVRLGDGGPGELRNRLDQAVRDQGLVGRLAAIRMDRISRAEEGRPHLTDAYADAFRDAGLLGKNEAPQVMADRLGRSDIRDSLVAAIDDWALCDSYLADARGQGSTLNRSSWLLEVARKADPDPSGWRDRLRDPSVRRDKQQLGRLADSATLSDTPVNLLVTLGELLQNSGGDAIPYLLTVQQQHPDDLWVNFLLGSHALNRNEIPEALRNLQAALATRPETAFLHRHLGLAFHRAGRLKESLFYFSKAVQLEPEDDLLRLNFGDCLVASNRIADAAEQFRLGLDCAKHIPARSSLRRSLLQCRLRLGETKEVDQLWQESLGLKPPVHNDWDGYAEFCLFHGRLDEYLTTCRSLITNFGTASDPQVAERTGRACLLSPTSSEILEQATALIDRALADKRPELEWAHPYFMVAKGLAEYRHDRLESAISIMDGPARTALQSVPGLVSAMARHRLGRKEEALRTFAAAIGASDWEKSHAIDREKWIYHVLRREAEAMMLPKLPAFLEGTYLPLRHLAKIDCPFATSVGWCSSTRRGTSLA